MPTPRTNIVLVGFMGSGKSSIGRIVAGRLGFLFVDTDLVISQRAGMEISAIFAKEGEDGFRDRETEAIESLGDLDRCVIATGGGAVLRLLPFIGREFGGLPLLLFACVLLTFGNALASPALTSLVSKVSKEEEQGSSLGIMQSSASLARGIGPVFGGILLNNALNKLDEFTLYRTFWAASAIMLFAFLAAIYFMRIVRTEAAT